MFWSLFLQPDIGQKIKDAPDSSYEIGVFIGSMIPFLALVALAYLLFRYRQNHNEDI